MQGNQTPMYGGMTPRADATPRYGGETPGYGGATPGYGGATPAYAQTPAYETPRYDGSATPNLGNATPAYEGVGTPGHYGGDGTNFPGTPGGSQYGSNCRLSNFDLWVRNFSFYIENQQKEISFVDTKSGQN